ncbi:MAG TPA: potassium-transporting ATPase subunit KdpC [Candidatus Binataceae bacterium]|nr:potassium-transporting ATPase subunit KdpC [Candidatus Binataceae bacterium]
MRILGQAVAMTMVLAIVTGIGYPLLVCGIAEVIFPAQADGSLLTKNGKLVGSTLIGQNFSQPKYFHPRPSAAGNGYDAANSGGSNLAPTNKSLIDAVRQRVAAERASDGIAEGAPVPIDLVTSSASGLDPEITPAAAEYQVARVAKVRGMDEEAVRRLIAENTRGRWIGLVGEPGVNVLELNLALDRQASVAR